MIYIRHVQEKTNESSQQVWHADAHIERRNRQKANSTEWAKYTTDHKNPLRPLGAGEKMSWIRPTWLQYIPRNMHAVFALLCFVVVIHWLIFPYPSGLLHWHCGNLAIALVPAKPIWWIWINTSCEFIMNDCITTTKQSTTKPCAYFLGYTVQCKRIRYWLYSNECRFSVPSWYHAAVIATQGFPL